MFDRLDGIFKINLNIKKLLKFMFDRSDEIKKFWQIGQDFKNSLSYSKTSFDSKNLSKKWVITHFYDPFFESNACLWHVFNKAKGQRWLDVYVNMDV